MPTRVWYRWTKFPSVNMHRSIFSISLAALHQSLINFDTRPKNYPIFGLLKRAQMLKQYLSRLFTGDEMWHGYQEIEEISSWCERTSSERIYKALDKVHPAHHEQISPWSLETIQLGRNKLGPLYHMKEFLWVEISFIIPLPFTVLSFVQKFLKDIYYSWLKWAIMRVRGTVACRELYFSVCKDFTYCWVPWS